MLVSAKLVGSESRGDIKGRRTRELGSQAIASLCACASLTLLVSSSFMLAPAAWTYACTTLLYVLKRRAAREQQKPLWSCWSDPQWNRFQRFAYSPNSQTRSSATKDCKNIRPHFYVLEDLISNHSMNYARCREHQWDEQRRKNVASLFLTRWCWELTNTMIPPCIVGWLNRGHRGGYVAQKKPLLLHASESEGERERARAS